MRASFQAACLGGLIGACSNPATSRAQTTGPDAARIAIVQEALSRVSGRLACLSVDPTTTTLVRGGVVPKDPAWRASDPSAELMAIVGRKGLRAGSECPPQKEDSEHYEVLVGPILVHLSGRVEVQMAYGRGGFPTLEHCVAEVNEDKQWAVKCRVLWQA
jgi:hypothetical protein